MEISSLSAQSIDAYRTNLSRDIERIYDLAVHARSLGRDVTDRVEIPLASDMAERIEALLEVKGLAEIIRRLSADRSREDVAIEASREIAKLYAEKGKQFALDKAVRVGLAILTEGILVAPLEGIKSVEIRGGSGSDYVAVVYSGPIRGAGGTAQALSVLIADIVRRDLGISGFKAMDDEIERYIEEVQSYNRLKHLQYLPSSDEIRLVISNVPVMIDGEGSEEEEISGHRDMARIKSNRIRGGMCLVLCEGLIQKSKKIMKYTSHMKLSEWNFLDGLSGTSEDKKVEKKEEKFLKDIIAGRPVFSHPGRPGGFRLRYGRSRTTGLAAAGVNPASMEILGGFIAVGSQMKIELPGKAAAITPCEEIEGPMVMLKDGRHMRINDMETAKSLKDQVMEITDLGEILIGYGEFLENNHRLERPSFTVEWWRMMISGTGDLDRFQISDPDQFEAVEISRKYGIPIHPKYDYFWHDLSYDSMLRLRGALVRGKIENGTVLLPKEGEVVEILKSLGLPFSVSGNEISIHEYFPLISCLNLAVQHDLIVADGPFEDSADPVTTITKNTGIKIIPRAPTRIGARMGRPEKAGSRKMKPMVHVLFPVEEFGSSRRSVGEAMSSKGDYLSEVTPRVCSSCGNITVVPLCEKCGGKTMKKGTVSEVTVNLSSILSASEERSKVSLKDVGLLKGVKKLMSSQKVCEPLEKGLLRAKNSVSVNKDGTCRYDLSDIPITHFIPEEIALQPSKAEALGYVPGKMNEIFPQDIIIPYDAAEYLLNVSRFVDDLLMYYYGLPPFYSCNSTDDLIGHLVIGLAPHTSGGIVGRIIGFTKVSGCYAHPFFHASKRRNCDGDEDSIMLLLEGLLNFSREFLPSTTGGLMDAPLVLTEFLNPDEIDKEAMNVDTLWKYPLAFYEAAEKMASPSEIESIMFPMKAYIASTGSYCGIGFTTSTENINSGVLVSSYKTIGTMEEKIEKQLKLAAMIRAVDVDDVAARVLNSHFLPDIYGNFRGFFSQTFRCTKCNRKFRRVPLSGKCPKCGSDRITLTVHKGGIVKYLQETIKISREYGIPDYMKARIDNLSRTIYDTFGTDPEIVELPLEEET